MRSADVRAFVQRDWAAVERAKLDYWVELARASGPGPAVRAADELRRHAARFARGDAEACRRDDLAAHVVLKRRIDAASRRLGR